MSTPALLRPARRAITPFVVALALALSLPVGPASAAGTPTADRSEPSRTIDVVGTGAVRGTPDVLDLVLGIEVRAKGAADALRRNNELLRDVLGVLRDAGVADGDIRTAALSIWPVTDDDGIAVIAYSVSNTVQVTVRDLDAAGSVIDEASAIADDEIVVHGVSFSFDDNSRLVAQARAEAVRRARAQAEQLADAAGVTLGRLLTIDETSTPPAPTLRSADAAGSAEASVPIEPGTRGLSVQVQLRFEIT